ncbi:threonine/serine dehydratase [Kitasatospora sp. NBC_01287]|uniref:threonine/serine dehydratase n=1 Tax=Kitasatospora sp. NBC_01287 TaxID=2903573 RepID=UPI00225A69A8|nr:threonine/serine dehydratase [Kitasatospora sp. NBC_01287]MCX4745586.1 threonine/serine dehydratase [Kitasatospora sp. NBC_01287]
MLRVSYDDVKAAAERIDGVTRPVPVIPVDPGAVGSAEIHLALEFMQHSGSFKDRGAANFAAAHLADGTMPNAGVVIASGGNAGLACAWAAARHGVPATVFVPRTAPEVKVARLRALGAEVRQVGTEYAQAQESARLFSAETGALASHAYDDPYVVAGAGTLLPEIRAAVPGLDTVVLAVGGGGLFAGTAIAAERHGLRVVAVEPERCRALNAAIEAGEPVDVEVASVAADSLGARRVSETALYWARRSDTVSLLVSEEQIIAARRTLWEHRRLVVEHAAATALAALMSGVYRPSPGERVAVVLCGANTDPATVA